MHAHKQHMFTLRFFERRAQEYSGTTLIVRPPPAVPLGRTVAPPAAVRPVHVPPPPTYIPPPQFSWDGPARPPLAFYPASSGAPPTASVVAPPGGFTPFSGTCNRLQAPVLPPLPPPSYPPPIEAPVVLPPQPPVALSSPSAARSVSPSVLPVDE